LPTAKTTLDYCIQLLLKLVHRCQKLWNLQFADKDYNFVARR